MANIHRGPNAPAYKLTDFLLKFEEDEQLVDVDQIREVMMRYMQAFSAASPPSSDVPATSAPAPAPTPPTADPPTDPAAANSPSVSTAA
jgi:hypothetical protein